MNYRILGTAGHIDHGKTSLVRALTGIDCDRLPEEKARGITIDIGFAHMERGEYRLGIVDVPGHERFVRNMLAGASGIDLALLVVSADGGVMPQTREHLEILRLLGVRHGVIALTRCDLADAVTRELTELEVRELVADTFLANASLVFTSASTGEGIPQLRDVLFEVAQLSGKPTGEWFRLAVDRAFSVAGHGSVVTGSVASGSLQLGDEVDWLHDGIATRVRVRGLHSHDQATDRVTRGQRAAINLAGVEHTALARGHELASPGYLVPSRILTVQLRNLPVESRQRSSHKRSEAKPSRPNRLSIRHRLPVRVHLATAEIMGTVSLLDCDELAPASTGLAQLFLDEPATAVWGQPFVLRDSAAESTLGGGQVLQPTAHKLRRRHLKELQRVEQLLSEDMDSRILAIAGYDGLSPAKLVREAGLSTSQSTERLTALKSNGKLIEVLPGRVVAAEIIRELEIKLLAVLDELHSKYPLMASHDRRKVLSRLHYLQDEPLVAAIAKRLEDRGEVVADSQRIARASFKPKLSSNQKKLKERIIEAYLSAGFQPPELTELARGTHGNPSVLNDIVEVCELEGHLVRISADILLHCEHEARLRQLVCEKFRSQSRLTVAEIRDLLGTTRKYAVPFCEYLDREGVTVRQGDQRTSGPACGV